MSPFPWLALNLSTVYLVLGIFSPFWGVWLDSVGLSAEEIGLLIGLGYATRVLGNLVILKNVKRAELLIPVMRILIWAGLLCFAGFYLSHQFWPVLLFTLLASFIYPTLLPLCDAISARMALQVKLDYGRVRLWGSAAFIVGVTLIGFVISHFGPGWIHHCIVIGLLIAGFCVHLPMKPAPESFGQEREGQSYWQVLNSRPFLVFLAIEALLYGSHAAYNSFSSIYWKAQSIPAPTISALWTTGVLFEIGMFAVSRRLLSGWSPEKLMLIAAVACLIRWATLGSTLELWALFPAQALHAATYVLAHLGAMRYLSDRLPHEAMIPGQTLYSAIGQSLSQALMIMVCGFFYRHIQGNIFWLMFLMVIPVFYLLIISRRQAQQRAMSSIS